MLLIRVSFRTDVEANCLKQEDFSIRVDCVVHLPKKQVTFLGNSFEDRDEPLGPCDVCTS